MKSRVVEFDDVTAEAKQLVGIHDSIAADAFPTGAMLECNTCKDTLFANQEACAQYLRKGWPRCCGKTMTMREGT
jgi:hypothetical protein